MVDAQLGDGFVIGVNHGKGEVGDGAEHVHHRALPGSQGLGNGGTLHPGNDSIAFPAVNPRRINRVRIAEFVVQAPSSVLSDMAGNSAQDVSPGGMGRLHDDRHMGAGIVATARCSAGRRFGAFACSRHEMDTMEIYPYWTQKTYSIQQT